MATISNASEMRAAFPNGFLGKDLKKAVQDAGHHLSPLLAAQYDQALAQIRGSFPESLRQSWRAKTNVIPRITTRPQISGELTAGEVDNYYDVSVAVKVSLLEEALAGLHAAHTIPHFVELSEPLGPSAEALALAALRSNFEGIPEESNLRMGDLQILPNPRLDVIPGTNRLRLSLNFAVHLARETMSPTGESVRVPVTEIRGAASFEIQLRAEFDVLRPKKTRLFIVFSIPSAGFALELAIQPDSPVQPRPQNNLDGLASLILAGLGSARFAPGHDLKSWTVSPNITLPEFNVNWEVKVVHLELVADSDSRGVVCVGLFIDKPANPPVGDPVPSGLTNPFTSTGANLWLRVREQFLQRVLDDQLASGSLETEARKATGIDSIRLSSAKVKLENSKILLHVTGRKVDACSFVVTEVDAPFEATLTLTFQSYLGTPVDPAKITVSIESDVSPDWSSGNTYLCILAAVAEGLLGFYFGFLVAGFFGGALAGLFAFFSSEPVGSGVLAKLAKLGEYLTASDTSKPPAEFTVALDNPIPGTELLPEVALQTLAVERNAQESQYRVRLVPDNVNYHIFAAFRQFREFPLRGSMAVRGARVFLVDQDVPKPASDDAQIPAPVHSVFSTPKVIKTFDLTFRPPEDNERLAAATTSIEGLAHFIVKPSRWSTGAGTIVEHTVIKRLDLGLNAPSQITHKEPTLVERKPDVFFLLQLPGGFVFDTRGQPAGFFKNCKPPGKRLGSADEPLMFHFGGGGGFHP